MLTAIFIISVVGHKATLIDVCLLIIEVLGLLFVTDLTHTKETVTTLGST